MNLLCFEQFISSMTGYRSGNELREMVLTPQIGDRMLCKTLTLNSDKKAFTLIELIIVLFIIGIVSTLVGGTFYRSIDNVRLKTAAKEMAASLRYIRSKAIAEKNIYYFIADSNGYEFHTDLLAEGNNPDLEKPVYNTRKNFHESIYLENTENTDIRVEFFPEGNSTGGEILLKNTKSSSCSISIEKINGRVKIN